jgi:hypothetical protein
MAKVGRLLYIVANFIPISARHGNIGENGHGAENGQPFNGGDPIGYGLNLKSFTLQNSHRSLLNGRAIVGNQNNPSHRVLLFFRQTEFV